MLSVPGLSWVLVVGAACCRSPVTSCSFFTFELMDHLIACPVNTTFDMTLPLELLWMVTSQGCQCQAYQWHLHRCVNIPLMRLFGGCIITLLVNNFPTVQFKFNGYLSRIPQSSSSVASSQSRLRSQRDSRGTQLPDLHVNSV